MAVGELVCIHNYVNNFYCLMLKTDELEKISHGANNIKEVLKKLANEKKVICEKDQRINDINYIELISRCTIVFRD